MLLILADVARGLPWNRLTQGMLLLIIVVSLVQNGKLLYQVNLGRNNLFATQDAELQVTWMLRQAPGLDRKAKIDEVLMPPVTVRRYLDSRQILGSDLASIDPSGLASLNSSAVNLAFANDLPTNETLVAAATPVGTDPCTASDTSGLAKVQGADHSVWLVTPSSAGPVSITVWYEGPASSAPSTTLVVGNGQSLEVVLPDSGLGLTWHLQAAVPAYLGTSICGTCP